MTCSSAACPQLPLRLLTGAFLVLAALNSSPARGGTLTSIVIFSANPDGDARGSEVWNTHGPGPLWNVWIAPGTPGGSPDGLTAPLINGPLDQDATIQQILRPGTNRFTLFGQPGFVTDFSHVGINLFFDGGQTPEISALAPTRLDQQIPGFAPNASSSTAGPAENSVPASGALKAERPAETIELMDFYWAAPNVFSVERVSGTNTDPAGGYDFVGSVVLRVRPKPHTATIRVSEVEIAFGTVAGARYQVQYSQGAPDGPWLPVNDPQVGTGDTVKLRQPVPDDGTQRYYRVLQLSTNGE